MIPSDPSEKYYSPAGYFVLLALGAAVAALDRLLATGPDGDFHADVEVSYHTRLAILLAAFDLETRINQVLEESLGHEIAVTLDRLQIQRKFTFIALELGEPPPPGHIHDAFMALKQWRDEFAHGKLVPLPKGFRPGSRVRQPGDIARPGIEVAETLRLLRGYLQVIHYLDELSGGWLDAAPEANAGVIAATLDQMATYQFDDKGWLVGRQPEPKYRDRPPPEDRFLVP